MGNATFALNTIPYFQIRHVYIDILMVLIVCIFVQPFCMTMKTFHSMN